MPILRLLFNLTENRIQIYSFEINASVCSLGPFQIIGLCFASGDQGFELEKLDRFSKFELKK